MTIGNDSTHGRNRHQAGLFTAYTDMTSLNGLEGRGVPPEVAETLMDLVDTGGDREAGSDDCHLRLAKKSGLTIPNSQKNISLRTKN